MLILNNAHIKKNLRFFLFLKIITIIILIWIYHPYHDVFSCGIGVQNKCKEDSTLNIILKRYMSEDEYQNELDRTGLNRNFPYNYDNKRTNIYTNDTSIYGHIKNRDSKKLKLYKTAYNHRYAKKKGLSKLDCYYENKIFKKIDYLYNLADNWHSDKKSFKKKIMKKYGIRLILLAILPSLGLIYPILFGLGAGRPGIFGFCKDSSHRGVDGIHKELNADATKCPEYWRYENCVLITSIGYINYLISSTVAIIYSLVIIYILLKIIKYERLREGKSKMRKKEYFNYSKEVFNLK